MPQPQPAATFPPHGSAYVTSLPQNASAWLDGTYIGSTPVYVDDLLPGKHSVTLSSAGWQPQTVMFDVAVGRIAPVSIVMARSIGAQGPKGQGTLAFAGIPPGSRVYVDGALLAPPVEARSETAGYHIVTLQPTVPDAIRSTRVVDVFPNTTTTVSFAGTSTDEQPTADDILEPIDSVVPLSDVVIAGNDVIIHYRNVEVECAIGERGYTINGKQQTMSISPALVAGKVYLPQSLLARLAGK